MSVPQIPNSVVRLITDSIDSVPELEALLLLRQRRDRVWTPAETAVYLYVSMPIATYVLELLAGRGFLIHAERGYRYQPVTRDLGERVSELALAYTHHLIAVTSLVHRKHTMDVRELAEAFRLRKNA